MRRGSKPLPGSFLETPLAHRGLHDMGSAVPENSRGAFRRAAAAGFGIECDLQLSADGVAMVFHDATLDRLCGRQGPVHDLTARELGDLPLFGSSDHIPTLAEALEVVDGRVPILIELKDQSDGAGTTDRRLEEAAASVLRDYDGPVAVMSFNPAQVATMAELLPDVPRGLTTCGFVPSHWPMLAEHVATHLRGIADFDAVRAGFVSHDWTDLGNPRIAELKYAGVPVLTWTVRSPQEEAEARRIADNVTFEGYLPPVPAR
ncbi:phosphodiesterase [Rhodobacterales bacterium HKCCE2091]|nr:phosphodiesterase [Rhodobacterales bacterium HKCCE2091]